VNPADADAPVLVAFGAHPAASNGSAANCGNATAGTTRSSPHRCRQDRRSSQVSPRPWSTPDESFHRAISEFLSEWSRLYRPAAGMVRVVGRDWDGPTHQLRDLLSLAWYSVRIR